MRIDGTKIAGCRSRCVAQERNKSRADVLHAAGSPTIVEYFRLLRGRGWRINEIGIYIIRHGGQSYLTRRNGGTRSAATLMTDLRNENNRAMPVRITA